MKHVAISICLLSSTLLISACGAAPAENGATAADAKLEMWPMTMASDEARQEVADGLRENDMGRVDEAYTHFQRAIALDSTAAMPELLAGITAQSTKDGFAHQARAAALASKASAVEQLLIQINDRKIKGDLEGAETLANQLVKVDSANPRSWMVLADIDTVASRIPQAHAALDRAIQAAPDFSPAYIMQSATYAFNQPTDYVKAEETARRAVQLDSMEALPYDILGDALRAQGKLEEAAKAYTRQAELESTDGSGLQQRGHVNSFLGRFAEARADYDAAVALSKGNAKPGYALYRPNVSVYEGKPRAAYDELNQLYNSIDAMNIPGPREMKLAVAGAQLVVAFDQRMLKEMEAAAARVNENSRALAEQAGTEEYRRTAKALEALNNGYIALVKGDFAGAEKFANENMKIRELEHSPTKLQDGHALLGAIALEQKRYSEAVTHLDQAAVGNVYAQYERAVALEGAGRSADAQTIYQRLAGFYFNPVENALIRARVLAKVSKSVAAK